MMDQETLNSVLTMVEKFSDKELATNALKIDGYPVSKYPLEILNAAKEIGLFQFLLSDPQGGVGGSPEEFALLLDVISQREAGFASILLSHSLAQYLLSQSGKEVSPGEILCFPLYLDADNLEPYSLESIKSGEGKIRVSGKISSMPGAGIAQRALIPVKEQEGISLFSVKVGERGVKLGEQNLTLGLRSACHQELILENAELLEKERLGELGSAQALCQSAYLKFYPCLSAILIGLIIGSAKSAIRYGLERYQGGDLIANYEQMRFYYGRMLASYYSLKLSLERIADKNSSDDFSRISLKLLAGELAVSATMDGVQLLGGYGYMHDYGQEKRMRDARQVAGMMGVDRFLTVSLAERLIKNLT